MSKRESVLITGPLGRTDAYVAAAQKAGWHAQTYNYIAILPLVENLAPFPENVDCLCITSKHALRALEHRVDRYRQTPLLAVGEYTTKLASDLGFESVGVPAKNAKDLRNRIVESFPPASRIVWLRGSLSDELAQDLRLDGFEVHAPVVYATTAIAASEDDPDLSETDAVFFTSPSGVLAFIDLHRGDQSLSSIDAIAIGTTTANALENIAATFRSIRVSSGPTPAEFSQQLRSLLSP